MASKINRLSARTVASLAKPGRHADGGNLYLNVTASGARSWVFMYKLNGRQREMGLGSARDVSLAKARDLAAKAREAIAEGKDPLAARQSTTPTFGECADDLIASMEGSWRNEKHAYQWRQTLTSYVEKLRELPVDKVTMHDVLEVLQPIWQTKPETASRLRGRVEQVLDAARVKGYRSGDNPARWRGHLDKVLAKRKKLSRGHHPAMPVDDVPAFMKRLAACDRITARALEFTILTAARTGEVLGARWEEFDLDRGIWTIPAARTKAGAEHRSPLSPSALAIVVGLAKVRTSEFLFPSGRPQRPLWNMAMIRLMHRLGPRELTVHGFRSSFRDWAAECTSFPHDVCEMALAHTVSSKVEAAYRRGDLFEKRTKLMTAWASFCIGDNDAKVLKLPMAAG